MGWSSKISFKEFCDFLQRLVRTKTKPARLKRLVKFLDHWRRRQAESGGTGEEQSLFPLMRLLLPQLDKDRGVYNIKESVLADLYIEFLQLGKSSPDALKLKNYRAPKAGQDEAGDFAAVLFTVMQGRSYAASDISCAEVNQRLDDIVRANAESGRRAVAQILKELFLCMDAAQQKWFVRLILKDMKVSLGFNSILSAFHPDARDLYDVTANLRKVCERLPDPAIRLNEIAIQLGQPFRPQLADRIPIRGLDKWLKGRPCYVETKYDGERLQVHKDSNRYRYFSRNGNEFTEDFGSDAKREEELLTGYLAQSLAPHVMSIILDGEICAWNHQLGTFSQQSQYKSIRGLRAGHPVFQQCFVIYDICYLNGRVLTNLPLRERIPLYEAAVRPLPGRVQFTHRTLATNKTEVVAALNIAIDRREEGLVLKDPDSVYKPNARAGGGWVKLKPEYENELIDQLDLLVLGGYYGSGGGGGTITQFLMGVRDAAADRPRYLAFCRVGSGYTDMELKDLVSKCGRPLKTQPAGVCVSREKPTVWYEPAKAPVLQLKAAEIVLTSTYPTGCTLRFPRVQCARPDRDHTNCTSIQELEKLRHQSEGKLFGGLHLVHEDEEEEVVSPRKRPRLSERPQLGAAYTQADYSLERVDTFNLKGRIVVVEPSLDVELKRRLERAVIRHGGTVEQNVRPGVTSCYVQSEGKLRAKNVVNQGLVDVVKSSWLLDCEKEYRDYRPHDMVFTTPATRDKWKLLYDEFGDSFTDNSSPDDLRHSLINAAQTKTTSPGMDLEEALSDYVYCMLRGKTFYFDGGSIEEAARQLAGLRCRLYGGAVVESLSQDVTHIVVEDSGQLQDEAYQRERRSRVAAGHPLFHVISYNWIRRSAAEGKLLELADFEL